MMKNKFILFYFLTTILLLVSCKDEEKVLFTGDDYQNIMQYMLQEEDQYSSFISIVRAGKMEDMLSSYNSNIEGQDYTLFLPNNDAVNLFIENSTIYSSLEELLADSTYALELVKYHTLNTSVYTDEFPNGVMPTRTLSDDFLTIIFSNNDGEVNYRINNQSSLIIKDIELSNGIIHTIDQMLEPIIYTAYEWVKINSTNGYGIFSQLLDSTGLKDTLNYYELDDIGRKEYTEYTMFAETDELYLTNGISSFEDLATRISPSNQDYTSENNALNKYARYHILVNSYFLDEFESSSTSQETQVYETYGDYPISIDLDLDLKVNVGTAVFDSNVSDYTTTNTNYLLFDNESSNKLTKTGALHELNQMLYPFLPSKQTVTLQFYNDKSISAASEYEGAVRIIQEDLTAIELEGVDYITYSKESTDISGVSNSDYVYVYGNFKFTYHTPRLLAGKYKIVLVMYSGPTSADFIFYFNEKKTGSIFRLYSEIPSWLSGGRDRISLGEVNVSGYESQELKFSAISPGELKIDRIIFEPIN